MLQKQSLFAVNANHGKKEKRRLDVEQKGILKRPVQCKENEVHKQMQRVMLIRDISRETSGRPHENDL